MGRGYERIAIVLAAGFTFELACTTSKPPPTTGASASASAGSSSGATSGGSTSAGPIQGTGSSGGAGSTSAGSTTGPTPSPYFDGGYVFCAASVGDGGLQRWMCQPGTYFCDTGPGAACSQCRSDSDCTDTSLPTYDPRRPRCDLDSGVAGYQGFCQQCIADTDCPDRLGLMHCDLNPTFPPNAAQPPIVTVGFEACGPLETDCRKLNGPNCRALEEHCNTDNGRCEAFPNPCVSDQDCIGRFDAPYLREPFCVDGACQACDGGPCPYAVECTDSSQCGGYWPVCLGLDGGLMTSEGQAAGSCGCDDPSQCGDSGLTCLSNSFCGVPCYSTEAWGCGGSACDFSTGVCVGCTTDADCQDSFGSFGPQCVPPPSGTGSECMCLTDNDCPFGYACQGSCVPALPHCTPSTCDGLFCDWVTGVCADLDDPSIPRCVEDSDCGTGRCRSGACYPCLDNSDCTAPGPSDRTFCCHWGEPGCEGVGYGKTACAPVCHVDADCAGNTNGSRCEVDAGGRVSFCGCASDAECAGNARGTHCVTDPGAAGFGTCGCQTGSDCPSGDACEILPTTGDGGVGLCVSNCGSGPEDSCQVGFDCGPDFRCRPRCDEGFSCATPDLRCDVDNVAGQNGLIADSSYIELVDGGSATWCFQCLDSRDCDGHLGCVDYFCQPCADAGECYAGSICSSDGLCHSTCDAAACPAGQICDVDGRAGEGSLCFECVSSADCPDGQGCDSKTHTCGTCQGPYAVGGPYDCPPNAICSAYWGGGTGVCLQNCDRDPCPPSAPNCGVFPSLTPDHAYCFGCREDDDCADGGRCDSSIHRTFQCLPGSSP